MKVVTQLNDECITVSENGWMENEKHNIFPVVHNREHEVIQNIIKITEIQKY